MADTPMVTPAPAPAAPGQPMQTQCVYIMPAHQMKPARIIRPVPGVKCLSIATIVIGAVLVLLGIIAIVLKARMSYIADPIWTGLLFMVTTGILGIFVNQKKNNLCMNIAYLVMAIISAVFAYQLMEVAFTFAAAEQWGCMPYHYYYPGSYSNCPPMAARIAVGMAIGFCAIAALVLCVVSCSVTIYGTFTCCYNCCSCCRTGSTSTVQYSAHSGQGIQVMEAPHLIPQGNTQQPGGTQHVMIAAAPQQHMQYPHYSPPAYMPTTQPVPSTQAFLVTNSQQPPANQSSAPSALGAGQQADRQQNTQDHTEMTADKPQNWQTFQ